MGGEGTGSFLFKGIDIIEPKKKYKKEENKIEQKFILVRKSGNIKTKGIEEIPQDNRFNGGPSQILLYTQSSFGSRSSSCLTC